MCDFEEYIDDSTLGWLHFFLKKNLQDISNDVDLQIALFALKAANSFFKKLHSWGLWLDSRQHAECKALARAFCQGYCQLATTQARQGYLMFRVRPKLHMFYELIYQNSSSQWAMNCINASTWNDEDFIGKVSRLSRSCAGLGLSQSLRCIQKVLGKYKIQFMRFN